MGAFCSAEVQTPLEQKLPFSICSESSNKGIVALLDASTKTSNLGLLALQASGEELTPVSSGRTSAGDVSDCARNPGIVGLLRVSPEARWVSLLLAAAEMETPPDTADEPDCVRHPGIADLLRISPDARWVSLLLAAEAKPDELAPADPISALRLPSAALVDSTASQAVGGVTVRSPIVTATEGAVNQGDWSPGPSSPASPSSAAEWVPDASAKGCQLCGAKFTVMRRRHHCRSCGQVVCSSCSTGRKVVATVSKAPVRCCDRCMADSRSG